MIAAQAPAERARVEVVRDEAGFLALEPAWNRLVDRTGIDHPFLTHEWMRTWWEAFGAQSSLYIIQVIAHGETVALAPLQIEPVKMYGFTLRQIGFLYNAHSPRCDFIVAPGHEYAYDLIREHLAGARELWDVLALSQLPCGSPTLEALQPLADQECRTGLWHPEDSPFIPVRGTWDDYFAQRDRKHRSNVRNRLNRLARMGELEFEEFSGLREAEAALEEGLRIEAKAWKGDAGTAILSRPDLHTFYKTLALRAAVRGWLRLSFLRVGTRRIAFDFSLCYKHKIYILKPGYDPEFAPYSPYNSLCYLKLRKAFDTGITECDFLGVSDPWKLDWTNETRPHVWFYAFQNRFPANVVHAVKFGTPPELKSHPLYRSMRDLVVRLQQRRATSPGCGRTAYLGHERFPEEHRGGAEPHFEKDVS